MASPKYGVPAAAGAPLGVGDSVPPGQGAAEQGGRFEGAAQPVGVLCGRQGGVEGFDVVVGAGQVVGGSDLQQAVATVVSRLRQQTGPGAVCPQSFRARHGGLCGLPE